MDPQSGKINETHNLFLHRYLDNEQVLSVVFMRLDSHKKSLYHRGVEAKYLTNLIAAGRNFIEVFAVFQRQITLSMGRWHIYEDIISIQQWEKTIVINTGSKIVGLIYEDCILKNSFMLSLQFLELGFKEKIQIGCDHLGQYFVVATARQILLCISQKAIQKYNNKPFYHRGSIIVEEDIFWNRAEFQSISNVIKFDLFDFEIAKVECFHFSDQELYFLGYSSKTGSEKNLYYIPMTQIFSDDENQSLILNLAQQSESVRSIYPIRRQNESEFLVIRDDNSIELQNQKGTIIIESEAFKNSKAPLIVCKKNNLSIFPLEILFNNTIYIYEKMPSNNPTSNLSIASQFFKRQLKLPADLHIVSYDIKEYLFAYCNKYETGILILKNSMESNKMSEEHKISKSVLRQSFGSIIDFNIGRNLLIIENYHENKCRLNLLRKGITEDSRSFVMHAKKNALQAIPQVKQIYSLAEKFDEEFELYYLEQTEYTKNIRATISNYLVIKCDNILSLYRQIDNQTFNKLFTNFQYFNVIYDETEIYSTKSWILLLWGEEIGFSIYKIENSKQSQELTLLKTIPGIKLIINKYSDPSRICKINEYLISIADGEQLLLHFYDMKKDHSFGINLPNEANNKRNSRLQIHNKKITFKKKDKDFFILEVVIILDGVVLQIWEVSVNTQEFKMSHRSEPVGEGLPILFASNAANNHKLRAITCPQYALFKQNIKSPTVIKSCTHEHQGQSFLFMINSNQELLMYKKFYVCQLNSNLGNNDVGYLYHRLPLQLKVVRKFKYNAATSFVKIGCGMLRICNLVFFKGQIFEMPENIVSCFEMDDEVWSMQSDGKVKMLITKGKVISHYLCTNIPTSIEEDILGIEPTNQYYIIYSRSSFEVFDKQIRPVWKPSDAVFGNQNKQIILAICAYDHYVAISYYNYCETEENKSEYQSIKFKLRIYNIITKSKTVEKEKAFEEPVLHIRYIAPDKLMLVTPSNIFVNLIKNDKTLDNIRNKNYSKRTMLSTFSYIPEKMGPEPEPGYMLFGGVYGGLSFMIGQWIDREKLDQIWFENLRCGVKEVQIFHYGQKREALKALIADYDENLIILDLKPKRAQKLVDFHIGSQITSMKKRGELPYISSDDGCIRVIMPIKLKDVEITFYDLQEAICNEIPFMGGFNTRDSRCLQQRERTYKITSKGNLIDGELIQDFMALTETLKDHIYEKVDLSNEDIKQQLLQHL